MRSNGIATAVATASPPDPPFQAAYDKAIEARTNPLNETVIPRAANARVISLAPKIMAVATTPANITRSYERANQTKAIRESPTAIEGSSFRPAFLLIASLIA
ncbi:unannotated protein [freshwater metagenome]|uniref:Unannotated protein n=1 Tax=freshwater metagenome TaxID=449393 RepID=A0A6J6IQR8_9ZZZZ